MEKRLKSQVKNFMTKKVVSVGKNENIKNIFQLMKRNSILGLPVIDEKKHLIGIVTESDLIKHFTKLETPLSINLLGSVIFLQDINEFNKNLKDHCAETVKDIMSEKVISIEENTNLIDTINLMSEKGISRLPITDKKGKLTGIITRTDIVRELAKLKNI